MDTWALATIAGMVVVSAAALALWRAGPRRRRPSSTWQEAAERQGMHDRAGDPDGLERRLAFTSLSGRTGLQVERTLAGEVAGRPVQLAVAQVQYGDSRAMHTIAVVDDPRGDGAAPFRVATPMESVSLEPVEAVLHGYPNLAAGWRSQNGEVVPRGVLSHLASRADELVFLSVESDGVSMVVHRRWRANHATADQFLPEFLDDVDILVGLLDPRAPGRTT